MLEDSTGVLLRLPGVLSDAIVDCVCGRLISLPWYDLPEDARMLSIRRTIYAKLADSAEEMVLA